MILTLITLTGLSLLAIYMPLLCARIHSCIQTWHIHPIRPQPNRPNVVPGKPVMNYHSPTNAEDHKQPFDQQLLPRLQADVSEWDPSEFLPLATFTWCHHQLQEIGRQLTGTCEGFNPEDPLLQLCGDLYQSYRVVYEELRRHAIRHCESGTQPILGVCAKPHGAYCWSPDADEAFS